MPAIDAFESHTPSLQSPVSHALSITPSDTADLAYVTRTLYVGNGGDVTLVLVDGSQETFVNMATGWHPIRAARVMATGTTASNILGCW